MKVILQHLFRSLLLYGFFVIWCMAVLLGKVTETAKTSGLSTTQLLDQFWQSYRWLLIIPHVLYILTFIFVQRRINWFNKNPPRLNKEQLKQKQQKADTLMRWVAGPAFLFSAVGLIGLPFTVSRFPLSIVFPLALFLLYVQLAADGLNALTQNYLHYFRKRTAKTVDDVLAENRKPILYLRSFLDDEVVANLKTGLITEEEELNKAFEHIGPLIAIGRPGEALPEVGAARAYFTDDKWQAAVQHYMDISCLIVLRAALSQGLLWEIQNSVRRLDPSKFILLIPFEEDAYNQFRTSVRSLFPKPLPDHPGHDAHVPTDAMFGKGTKFGSLLGLIYFDDDWSAHFEKISADHVPYPQELIGRPLEMTYWMVHYALKPVYTRLGLVWDDLGLRWREN